MEGNHCQYFNSDKNLMNLDIIVLAETKLVDQQSDESIERGLSNWIMRGRYDSKDQKKHMGLILLIGRNSKFNDQIQSLTIQILKRGDDIQIQGLIVRFMNDLKLGFLYCRSTPTHQEIKGINKSFSECHVLAGDFNLSHRIAADKNKLEMLCQETKVSILHEITRSQSNNQLDYILVDKILEQVCFATSFNNFVSDHKSVTVRIGLYGNKITDEIKGKVNFDKESHMKTKVIVSSDTNSTNSSMNDTASDTSVVEDQNAEQSDQMNMIQYGTFERKFINADMATCWLNSCLQLMLTAIDHNQECFDLSSEFGQELQRLWINVEKKTLDPTTVKNIIVAAEDIRISTMLSELYNTIDDQLQLENRVRGVQSLRLNLLSGQQCVRDYFVCLKENIFSWPDVCAPFMFRITHSTQCCVCNHTNQVETSELYVDIPVPPSGSCLSQYVSEYLNRGELVEMKCEEVCKKLVQKEKRSRITLISEAEFILIILTRAVQNTEGYSRMIDNAVIATEELFIRYVYNS